jgi:hypothetical protein
MAVWPVRLGWIENAAVVTGYFDEAAAKKAGV